MRALVVLPIAMEPRRRTAYAWLHRWAWPSYDCEDCIGMIHYGCQCNVYGAIAPGVGPARRHLVLRALATWIGVRR